MREQWNDFKPGSWTKSIDVRNFIQTNYTAYEGDDSFLAGATEATTKLWAEVSELFKKERENGGVLDVDTETISGINFKLTVSDTYTLPPDSVVEKITP